MVGMESTISGCLGVVQASKCKQFTDPSGGNGLDGRHELTLVSTLTVVLGINCMMRVASFISIASKIKTSGYLKEQELRYLILTFKDFFWKSI